MINMGKRAAFPSLRLGAVLKEAVYSDKSSHTNGRSCYTCSDGRYADAVLHDRQFYPALTPQLYMTTHSPRVSSLLWQRTLLNNRYQKNLALNNYLNAVSA